MEQSIGETTVRLTATPTIDATTFEQKSENVSSKLRKRLQGFSAPVFILHRFLLSFVHFFFFAVPQTDFSVARRLLSVDVGYQAAALDGKAEAKVPESPSVGWQFILPTDHRTVILAAV